MRKFPASLRLLRRSRWLWLIPVLGSAGATAVEYAVVIPILLFMLLGIIEYSLIMYASAVLEGATSTAAREGKTGYPDINSETTRRSATYALLKSQAAGILDPTKITISSKSYDKFSDIGVAEPCITPSPCNGTPGVNFVDVNGNGVWDQDQGKTGVGGASDIVVYTAAYPWPVSVPLLQNVLNNSGVPGIFNITSTTIVRNEPFTNTNASTPAPTPNPSP